MATPQVSPRFQWTEDEDEKKQSQSKTEPTAEERSARSETGSFTPYKEQGTPGAERRETLGREVSAFGNAIAGIPGGIYHAFADKPTEEERAEFKGDVEGPKRVGLGIHRLTTEPIETAARWYNDVAHGRVPNAYEQALSVAPEAIGMAAAAPVVEKLGEMAPRAAQATRDYVAPNPNFRPSVERLSGYPAPTSLERTANTPPGAPMDLQIRPSTERITGEGALDRRAGSSGFSGPERRAPLPAENLGFDMRPAEDLGNKVRAETEATKGPIKRGAKTLRQSEALGRIPQAVQEAVPPEAPAPEAPLSPYASYTPDQWSSFENQLSRNIDEARGSHLEQQAVPAVPLEEDLTAPLQESLRLARLQRGLPPVQ